MPADEPTPEPASVPDELTDAERRLLAFEDRYWRTPKALSRPHVKEADILAEFGVSAPRYYQRLNALLKRQAAVAAYPMLVHALLRLRDARRDARRGGAPPAGAVVSSDQTRLGTGTDH